MLKDEQRQEAAKLKTRPAKDKLAYFWAYYKWPVIAAAAAILIAVNIFSAILSPGKDGLQIIISDNKGMAADFELLENEYAARSEALNSTQLPLNFDTSMDLAQENNTQQSLLSVQKLVALNSSHSIDIFIAPESIFTEYGEQGMFVSLDTILAEDILKTLDAEGKIICITPDNDTDSEAHTTVTAGICLDNHPLLAEAGIEVDQPCIGIPASSQNKAEALIFLQLFLNE